MIIAAGVLAYIASNAFALALVSINKTSPPTDLEEVVPTREPAPGNSLRLIDNS